MAMRPTPQTPAMAPTPLDVPTGATTEAVPSTVSMDLPPSIQQLITMPTPGVNEQAVGQIPTGTVAANPQYPVLDFRMQPSYAEGGMVGPQGMPVRPAGLQQQQASGPMNPQMVDMQINDMLNKNPEVVARVRAAIEAGIQSGELNQQGLNMAVQLAEVVLQNPDMYPQMRQFAIQRGLIPAEDIPEQYDQGLVIAIIIAAKAMKADVQLEDVQMNPEVGQVAPMQGAQAGSMQQPPVQEMEFGGMVNGPSHEEGGVRVKMRGGGEIEVEGGEYVIPKKIVKRKGTEFFDKMLAQYQDEENKGTA